MTADFLDPTLTERRYSARPRISAPSIHLCSVSPRLCQTAMRKESDLCGRHGRLYISSRLARRAPLQVLSWRHGMTTQRYSGTYFRAIGPT